MSDVHVWQPHLFTRSKASVLHFLRHNRLRDYKQIQGYLNIKYNRGPDAYPVPIFQQALEQAMRKEKEQQAPNMDHLLITGDITNISLYDEFARVRQLLNEHFLDRLTLAQAKTLASQPQGNMDEAWRHVSIVPGNHDTYTHESIEKDYFGELFGDCLGTTSTATGGEASSLHRYYQHFPNIKVLSQENSTGDSFAQHVVILGLNTGYPTKPFVARGNIGQVQMQQASDLLQTVLDELAATQSAVNVYKIVMMHHPPVNRHPESKYHEFMHGMNKKSMELVQNFCFEHGVDLVLNGHTHHDYACWLPNHHNAKRTLNLDPGSSTQNDPKKNRVPRYNVYEICDAQLHSAEAIIWSSEQQSHCQTQRIGMP